MNQLPLSNFGAHRVPAHITPDVIVGQKNKRKIKRNKMEQKDHAMLKHFTVKGLPKNRHFDLDCQNPLSDSYLLGGLGSQGSHDSDTLQQFFGYESNSDEGNTEKQQEEVKQTHKNKNDQHKASEDEILSDKVRMELRHIKRKAQTKRLNSIAIQTPKPKEADTTIVVQSKNRLKSSDNRVRNQKGSILGKDIVGFVGA